MSSPAPAAQTHKSVEVRIGLVMYGGVSLAIYINGVAQEFFRAVKGRGVYRLIKALTDSDMVVDIISGSSAGGINGILLSYALANDKDFAQCSSLWREAADIAKLMRSPSEAGPLSVLDSNVYYHNALIDAFSNMRPYEPEPGEDNSKFTELDLFITGTHLDGTIYTRFDNVGHAIDVKDHRSVFLLKYREGRKNPFDNEGNTETIEALSKLARITSCFPGAFEPVPVVCANLENKTPDTMKADELLQYWGAFNESVYFVDGGVLDNKPFTHTIREIFYRTASREVDRKLFYVEPDPEQFEKKGAAAPNFLKPIVESLVGIPGYESIADDLKLLTDRNTKVEQYNRLVRDLEQRVISGRFAAEQRPFYDIAGNGLPSVEVPKDLPEPLRSLYVRSRYVALTDRLIRGMFKTSRNDNVMKPEDKEAAVSLLQSFDKWRDKQCQSYDGTVLGDFDIYFRLRRIFHVIYRVFNLLYKSKEECPPDKRKTYEDLWSAFNRQVKLLEIVSIAAEKLTDEYKYPWQGENPDRSILTRGGGADEAWNMVQNMLRALMNDCETFRSHIIREFPESFDWQVSWLTREELSDINSVFTTRITSIKRDGSGKTDNFKSILRLTDEAEHKILRTLLRDEKDPVHRAYYEFMIVDSYLYPVELISGLTEKDVIETVRISPVDAQVAFSQRAASKKVCGDSLAHFGAFFKRSWRSNDIMWGRLDALCELVEVLLTQDRVRTIAREPGRAFVFPPDLVKTLFPHAGGKAQAELEKWLAALGSRDDQRITKACEEAEFKRMRDLLIEVAQFEVLHDELDEVFYDAIKQQAEWNQFRVIKPGKNGNGVGWKGSDEPLDSLLATAYSQQAAEKSLHAIEQAVPVDVMPTNSELGRQFRSEYQVGSERFLKDIPPLVLLEILAKAMLVLRNCLLGVASSRRVERLETNRMYRWAVSIPLNAFYYVILILRNSPIHMFRFQAAVAAISLLAVFVGIVWPLLLTERLWFIVLVVIPGLFLTVQAFFVSRMFIESWWIPRLVQKNLIRFATLMPVVVLLSFHLGYLDGVRAWLETNVFQTNVLPPQWSQLLTLILMVLIPFLLGLTGVVAGGWIGLRFLKNIPSRKVAEAELQFLATADLQRAARDLGHDERVHRSPDRAHIIAEIVKKADQQRDWSSVRRVVRMMAK